MSNSESYFSEFTKEFEFVSTKNLELICECIISAFESGKTLYIAGNGGSAANANHFSSDLSNVFLTSNFKMKPKAISLCDSISRITALANDFGYEYVFSKQLTDANKGDVLLLLSVSGESKNLINAISEAKKHAMSIISIVAKESTISNLSDYFVVFGNSDYGISEDFQSIFLHMLKRKINGNIPHKCN